MAFIQNNFVELNLTRDENRYSWNNFPYNPRRYVILLQYFCLCMYGSYMPELDTFPPFNVVLTYITPKTKKCY